MTVTPIARRTITLRQLAIELNPDLANRTAQTQRSHGRKMARELDIEILAGSGFEVVRLSDVDRVLGRVCTCRGES